MNIKETIRHFVINIVSCRRRVELYRKWYGLKIGEGCQIFPDVFFGSEPFLIEIGDNVRITSGVKFCTHDGGMWCIRNLGWNPKADLFGTCKIGNNVHIGWNAVIMPNVTIGSNVVIGVGSVVTHDIPDNCVAAGIPARVIRSLESYYVNKKDQILDTKGMLLNDKKAIVMARMNIINDNSDLRSYE